MLEKFDEELIRLGYHLKQKSNISRYFEITYLDYQNQQQHIYFNEIRNNIEYSDYANLSYQNCRNINNQVPTFTTAMWTGNFSDDVGLDDDGIKSIVNYFDLQIKQRIEYKNKYPYTNQDCNQYLES